MAFLAGLLIITLLIAFLKFLFKKDSFRVTREIARIAAGVMFIQAGLIHLISPEKLIYMIEEWLPFPELIILATGITELLFGLGLFWKKTRRLSALLLILQLIAMFPANIFVAVNNLPAPGGLPADQWYTWSRLIFQPIYILWIYKSSIQPQRKVTVRTYPGILRGNRN